MYDAKVEGSELVPGKYPTWDLKVVNGIVPLISGDEEEAQRASVACFLQVGTIPQVPYAGVDWASFFLGRSSFGVLDTQVRSAIADSGAVDYEPYYDVVGDMLYTKIRKETA